MKKLKKSILLVLFSVSIALVTYLKTNASSMDVQDSNIVTGKKLLKAINDGKLVVPEYIKLNIADIAKNGFCKLEGKKARLSKPLLKLLDALISSKEISKAKPFSILSIFRANNRNHGAVQPNGEILGSAVDIDGFYGFKINIKNPTSSLQAIIKIINNMPQGTYNMGLPRPGGGKLIDPHKDFFLPVKDLKQNERSPTGSIVGDLKLIKSEKARIEMTKAVNKNKKAKILYLMPDATDHLHVKAIEEGKLY